MMNDTSCDCRMPYLQAIQRVPGNTASEKLKWIGKLASHCEDVIKNLDQLSPVLRPILQVEIAVKYKRHEDIASALKSDDSTIVHRALKASWFFDGSHEIVDVAYFCERIFPFVSLRTRIRIVKTLARRMKNPVFARQMFTAIASDYDIETALPLMIACDKSFIHATVTKKKLKLSVKIMKRIFRKYPDLGVYFLNKYIYSPELFASCHEEIDEEDQYNAIDKYEFLMPKLIKRKPLDFVKMVEEFNFCPLNYVMSNKCAKRLLNKTYARQFVIHYLSIFFPVMSKKIIDTKILTENMFRNEMRHRCDTEHNFYSNEMLYCLKKFPENKRLDLLRKNYSDIYQRELLDDISNVTDEVLQLLPVKQRIEYAKKFINIKPSHDAMNYKLAWICYFPVKKAISVIRFRFSRAQLTQDKLGYLLQMIFTCIVNKDDSALTDTLIFVKDKCKTADVSILKVIIEHFCHICDARNLGKRNGALLFNILQMYREQNEYVEEEMIHYLIHFRLVYNMPIADLIEMLLLTNECLPIKFNVLEDYPPYERKCLAVFLDVIRNKYFTGWQEELQLEDREENKEKLMRPLAGKKREQGGKSLKAQSEEELTESIRSEKKYVLCRLVIAMYNFNFKCKELQLTDGELLTIKDYPWLMDAIHKIMRFKRDFTFRKKVRTLLHKYEPELYRSWFLPSTSRKNIADVTSGAALHLLRRNFQSVLDNWEEYLMECKKHHRHKHVQRFVRATRWYKDIPVKFAERCIEHLHGKHEKEISSALIILSLLLQGNSLVKMMYPLIPTVRTAMNSYRLVRGLDFAMRFSNPPVPLELIGELCKGNHLSIVLMTLTSVIRRCPLTDAMSFTMEVARLNVNVRKHWIKLMYSTVSTHDLTIFLHKLWQIERHRSIRKLLFITIQKLFRTRPHPETSSLCYKIMLTLTVEDEKLLRTEELLLDFIPNEYFGEYYEQWFETIKNLSVSGLKIEIVKQHVEVYLAHLLLYIGRPLLESDISEMFQSLLFCKNVNVSEATSHYLIWFFLTFPDENYIYFNLIQDIFSYHVRNNYYKFHLKNMNFYLTNHVIHRFLDEFVISYVKLRNNEYYNPQLIHKTYKTYLSVLSPVQNSKTYLLLRYAKMLEESYDYSHTEFSLGKKLGHIMTELVDIFTPYSISFMSEVFLYFLNYAFDINCQQATKNVIRGLIHANNMYSSFMAVTMLSSQKRGNDRFIGAFEKSFLSHFASSIVFNHYRNTANFNDVDFDEFGDVSFNDLH